VGRYGLILVEGAQKSPNPGSWDVSEATGDLAIFVNFQSGEITGGSSDGRLTMSRADEGITIDEFTPEFALPDFRNGLRGEVTFEGRAGTFDARLNEDNGVGIISGQADDYFCHGGFVFGELDERPDA
jgi:hypothetical protein